MRTRPVALAFVLLLTACPSSPPPVSGADLAAPRDLASAPDLATGPDLSSPPADLASPPDLAKADRPPSAFCLGTAVEGTCLQSFFGAVSDCWPATGACTTSSPMQGASETCWQGGARFSSTNSMTTAHGEWKAANGTITCMKGDADLSGMGGVPVFTFASITGEKLGMDFGKNTYTCPDGSSHALPNNFLQDFGGCAALKALVSVPMGSCTQGKCP